MDWFRVDKEGLRQLVAGRSKGFVIAELVANAWDEPGVTKVDVRVERLEEGGRTWRLTVTDDSPDGFKDLRDTYTLYKPSSKKTNAILRGRFNLGEKLVLALCQAAEVISTTGGVRFSESGRSTLRKKRESGSQFLGILQMTLEEVAQMEDLFAKLIPPKGITTTFALDDKRGCGWRERTRLVEEPLQTIQAYLPTVLADEAGVLRDTWRHGDVEIRRLPESRSKAWVYELGIPVVELDDEPYDLNVLQKVPLTKERDATTSGFLSALRAAVLNARVETLTTEQASAKWVTVGAEHWAADAKTVVKTLDKRFGEKRVSADPSDQEATMKAASAGYTVVHGGSMSSTLWQRARDAGAIQAAGQVFPTRHTIEGPGGIPSIDPDDWTEDQRIFAAWTRNLCEKLVGRQVGVRLFADARLDFEAYWKTDRGVLGSMSPSPCFNWNLTGPGLEAFEFWKAGNPIAAIGTIVHECAHEKESNHLSESYHDELCRLAGFLAWHATQEPELVLGSTKLLHEKVLS